MLQGMEVAEADMPHYSDCEDEDRDLIAEAFGTSHLYTDDDVDPTGSHFYRDNDTADYPRIDQSSNKEYTELVPATVTELCAQDSNVDQSNDTVAFKNGNQIDIDGNDGDNDNMNSRPRRRSTRNKSASKTNGGRVSKKGKEKLVSAITRKQVNKKTGKTVKTEPKVDDMFVVKPNETKKQAVRRVKNNLASRDFRSRKKSKLSDMLERCDYLETENEALRNDLTSVEEVVRILKEGLIRGARNLAH